MSNLEADGAIWIYDIETGAEVASYEGVEVHKAMLELEALRAELTALTATHESEIAYFMEQLEKYMTRCNKLEVENDKLASSTIELVTLLRANADSIEEFIKQKGVSED